MAIGIVLLKISKAIAKLLKIVLFHNKFGIIQPKSITFSMVTLPTLLLLMSIHEKRYFKKIASVVLGIDLPENIDIKNNNHKTELLAVYLSFLIIIQILYVPLVVRSDSLAQSLKRGKLSTLTVSEIPTVLFKILSVIVIPRNIHLFVKNNIYFDDPQYSLIASNLSQTISNIFLVSQTALWNPLSTVISLIASFLTIRMNDADVDIIYPSFTLTKGKPRVAFERIKFRSVLKSVAGGIYPDYDNKEDDRLLAGFMFFFWIVTSSAIISKIDAVKDFFDLDESISTTLINLGLLVAVPIFFRNIAKYPSYQSELNTLGSLIGIFVPLMFTI